MCEVQYTSSNAGKSMTTPTLGIRSAKVHQSLLNDSVLAPFEVLDLMRPAFYGFGGVSKDTVKPDVQRHSCGRPYDIGEGFCVGKGIFF